jgi:hypothetical protein
MSLEWSDHPLTASGEMPVGQRRIHFRYTTTHPRVKACEELEDALIENARNTVTADSYRDRNTYGDLCCCYDLPGTEDMVEIEGEWKVVDGITSRGKVHELEQGRFNCVHYRVPAAADGSCEPRPLCGYGSWHLRWTENPSLVVCDACKEALEIIARFGPKPGTRIAVPVPEYYANLRKTILRLVELYGPSRDGTKISNNPYPYTRVETAYRYLLENTELNKTLKVDGLVGWDWVI